MKQSLFTDERIVRLQIEPASLRFDLADGRSLIVPLKWFPRLAKAETQQLARFEIVGGGFVAHWPGLDEDLEISGLLAGNADPSVRGIVPVTSNDISSYRSGAGISQKELADQLGVRQATISDWEKGKSYPSPLAKSKLAELIRKALLLDKVLPPAISAKGEGRSSEQTSTTSLYEILQTAFSKHGEKNPGQIRTTTRLLGESPGPYNVVLNLFSSSVAAELEKRLLSGSTPMGAQKQANRPSKRSAHVPTKSRR